MSEVVNKWDEFISALVEMFPKYIGEPIIYAVILLTVIVITALCSIPARKDRVNHNILGLISYSFKILLSFIGSILTAIESITNFMDVVRVILRGKLTEGTQFLLSNYAIVALSVASFYTTFNGLLRVSNWYIAIFITFGIQVGILAASSRLALIRNIKKERKYLRTITYEWVDEQSDTLICLGDQQTNKKIQDRVQADQENCKKESKTSEDDKSKKDKKQPKYIAVLVLCIFMSSYFSYVHFYETLVHPSAPMDNYMTAMNVVSDIVSKYSTELVQVQGALQKYLQDYNAQIREAYSDKISNVQQKVQYQEELLKKVREAEDEVMDVEREIQDLERELSALESGDTPDAGTQDGDQRTKEEIEDEIRILQNNRLASAQKRLKEAENDYENLRTQINDDTGYMDVQQVESALRELDAFYVNPLYMENESVSKDLLEDLSVLMEYEIANSGINDSEQDGMNERYQNLSIVFNNYMELSRYYVSNGIVGMNTKVIRNAQDNQENIIRRYQEAVAVSEKLEDAGEQTASVKGEDAADILNGETADLLMQMIGELNRIPVMEVWGDIDETDRKSINKLTSLNYNKKLYNMYRVSSGNINILEEAVRVVGNKRLGVSLLMMVMALFVDVMTVILTLTKDVNEYGNKLPLLRKIIHTIFFNEGTSEVEKHLIKVRRWVGGISLSIGLFIFIVYYITSGTKNNAVKIITLVAVVMGSMLVGCILIYVYERVCETRLHWKNEKAYNDLMDILNIDNVRREGGLHEKLDDCIDSNQDIILKADPHLRNLRDLLDTAELEEDESILTHRAKCLFKNVKVILLLRITMESHPVKPVSAMQCLKAGWQEYVYMAVLEEQYIQENHYNKEFAVLKARDLVYCVEDKNNKKYYVISDLFMKILYDLIMEEHSGSVLDAELSFAEHISDYYEEQDIL